MDQLRPVETNKMGPTKPKKRTAHEKRSRMSGKNTNKPYISSSLGDMCRHMIRMACTENTLGMTEPPPPEFYDYWHKFTISQDKLPSDYVDLKKVSIPRIKMNTSSFDFIGKLNAINSTQQFRSDDRNNLAEHNLAPALSDLWKDVRISMSTESFISSSTKISEPHGNVPLEAGWSDQEEDELSDFENEAVGSDSSVFKVAAPEGVHTSSHAGVSSKRQVCNVQINI